MKGFMEPIVRSENLRKVFTQPNGKRVEAVRDASFSVAQGEVLGLLGPNGAGKTTLLRMLGTLIAPTSGHCWIEGIRADEAPDAIRGRIGFLSGNTKLYGRLTVREVLRYFGDLYGMRAEDIASRTAGLSERLAMGEILDRRCESLSTGQTQKASIARVMLHDPKLLILDEPTLGLDIVTSRTILEFISDARARGHSIVFSTHYMSEAELLCDRAAFLYQGEIMAIGAKADLYARTGKDNIHDAFLCLLDSREQGAK